MNKLEEFTSFTYIKKFDIQYLIDACNAYFITLRSKEVDKINWSENRHLDTKEIKRLLLKNSSVISKLAFIKHCFEQQEFEDNP